MFVEVFWKKNFTNNLQFFVLTTDGVREANLIIVCEMYFIVIPVEFHMYVCYNVWLILPTAPFIFSF